MLNFMHNFHISIFFIFSYLYGINFILTPFLLIIDNNLQIQVISRPTINSLFLTIVFSLIAWLIVLLGYLSKIKSINKFDNIQIEISKFKLMLFILISIILFLYILKDNIYAFIYNDNKFNIFEFSNGNGINMILLSSYTYLMFFFAVYIYLKVEKNLKIDKFDYLIILILAFLMLFSTVILSTRRDLASFIMLLLLIMAIIQKNKIYDNILIVAIILIPFFSVFLQFIRFSSLDMMSIDYFIKYLEISKGIIISSFEGHWLATYFDKINLYTFFFGINPFEFIGNILSFVPRVIWESKPYNLGILEIQYFLAPQSFNENGVPNVTMPSTILVECLYSFGVFVTMPVLFYLGKFLKVLDLVIQRQIYKQNIFFLFLGFYTYVMMFNFIRGGSSFLIGLIVPLIYLMFIVNFKKKV